MTRSSWFMASPRNAPRRRDVISGARSNGLPRTCTSTPAALPTTTAAAARPSARRFRRPCTVRRSNDLAAGLGHRDPRRPRAQTNDDQVAAGAAAGGRGRRRWRRAAAGRRRAAAAGAAAAAAGSTAVAGGAAGRRRRPRRRPRARTLAASRSSSCEIDGADPVERPIAAARTARPRRPAAARTTTSSGRDRSGRSTPRRRSARLRTQACSWCGRPAPGPARCAPGSLASTGAGSICSARQTLAASARANTGSGKASMSSASSASSLLRRHLERRGHRVDVQAVRLARLAQHGAGAHVRAVAGVSGTAAEAPNSLACSIIEIPALVGERLPRLGEAPLQLVAELRQRLAVAEPAFDLDAEPQRLGIGRAGCC